MTFTAILAYTAALSVPFGFICAYFYRQGKADGRWEIARDITMFWSHEEWRTLGEWAMRHNAPVPEMIEAYDRFLDEVSP
jgi:hypothetical protein